MYFSTRAKVIQPPVRDQIPLEGGIQYAPVNSLIFVSTSDFEVNSLTSFYSDATCQFHEDCRNDSTYLRNATSFTKCLRALLFSALSRLGSERSVASQRRFYPTSCWPFSSALEASSQNNSHYCLWWFFYLARCSCYSMIIPVLPIWNFDVDSLLQSGQNLSQWKNLTIEHEQYDFFNGLLLEEPPIADARYPDSFPGLNPVILSVFCSLLFPSINMVWYKITSCRLLLKRIDRVNN